MWMERSRKIVSTWLLALGAGMALCAMLACGGASTPPSAPAQPALNVVLSPSTLAIVRGNQSNSTLTATGEGNVALSASGAPDGVSLSFDPGAIPGYGSSNLTVAVASGTRTGTYTIVVGGNENGLQQQTVLTLTVLAEVLLNWEASPSEDVIGYNVSRSETSGSGYVRLNTSLISGTSYVDNTVQSGHIYYYIAEAVDQAGCESVASNEASADVH